MRSIFTLLFISTLFYNLTAQTSKTMEFGGKTRKYLEYVPASYDGTQEFPIVLCLHGLGDNMNNFYNIGMNYIADTANFIVLTPEALDDTITIPGYGQYITGNAWNSGASQYGVVINDDIDDVGFLSALLDTVIENYNVSVNNIFVTGFSMGGFMTNRLACELNQRIKAAASVSGTMGASFTCNPASAIPVCHFHGTADGTVAYTNNSYGSDAEELVNYWIGVNNCDTTPIVDTLPDIVNDGKTVVHFVYPNGDNNTEVEFYKVLNGDHEWLSYPANDISYTIKIWEFFMKYRNDQLATSVNDVENSTAYSVYPNPAKDIVYVKSNNKITNYEIYSVSGTLISSKKIDKNYINISINNLKNGVYLLKLYSNNNCITKKIIVE